MNFCGLTDSLAAVSSPPRECPVCHNTSQISHGLCLGCLLHAGVAEENSDATGFAAALDEIAVPDTQWRLGNYEILEEIGRGGMGVIYRARQRHSRRIVALKRVLSYHADSRETLARFRREAEAAASLDHPNILPIYEVGESEEGVPYFSMKYAPGGSLQEGALALRYEPREVVRLMAKVARAVQYAHRQGILHRDLKPGNVLLDGRGEPMVSDFGLAKWLDTSSDLTRTLTIFGTPGYIAPEQAEGPAANLKPSSDVYSLGAILFDLLAGRPPFLGEHALAVIRQAAEKPAPKLRSLVTTADRDLETICARCLERERAARYQSAGDLAEDLERWLEGRPIIARPVAPPVRLWRWSKRNPVIAGSLAATIIIATLAIVRQIETGGLAETVREDQLASHSVTVLPFLDLDNASEDYDFTTAFAQALQLELKRFGPARTVPVTGEVAVRASAGNSSAISAAARDCRTRTVLSGTTRSFEGERRVSARLMDPDGNVLWRRIIKVSSVKPAQGASHLAAADIHSVLDAKDWSSLILSTQDPGLRNETARDFILAGRALLDGSDLANIDRAIDCFKKAIDAEPLSGLARASYASAVATRVHFQPDPVSLDNAEASARRSVELDPAGTEPRRALAGVLYQKGIFSKALDEALNAIETGGPEEHIVGEIGQTWKIVGRPDIAIAWFDLMTRSEARPANFLFVLADCWADLCEDNRAEIVYERVWHLRPELPDGWLGICRLRLLQSDFQGARNICAQNRGGHNDSVYTDEIAAQTEFFARNFQVAEKFYEGLEKSDAGGGGSFFGALSYRSVLGYLRFIAGDEESGRAILRHCLESERQNLARAPKHPEILYRIAAIESSLGDTNAALEALRAATVAGWIDYRSLSLDPRFDNLSKEPRFQEILANLRDKVQTLQRQMAGRINGPIKTKEKSRWQQN